MFSNPKKFFKKNVLLIGIVLLVILIVAYFLFMYNYKEGFDLSGPAVGEAPVKVKLIPVSTIEKFYNRLTDPKSKNIIEPVVELYKLFVANYDDVLAVSIQIFASESAAAVAANVPSTIDVTESEKARYDARNDAYKKWASKINPGLIKVLSNAIKWLPTAKRFYDKFVSNNYYGLIPSQPNIIGQDGSGPSRSEYESMKQMQITIMNTLINTLYEDDKLSIILGPTFAKSNPKPPFKFPVNIQQLQNTPEETLAPLQQYIVKYVTNVAQPFLIIQAYLTQYLQQSPGRGFIQNNVLTDTIIQLIEQLNTALANDATDQATITNLESKVDELTTQQSNSILNVRTNIMPTWSSSSSKPTTNTTKTTTEKPAPSWSPWSTTDKPTNTWSPWTSTPEPKTDYKSGYTSGYKSGYKKSY